MRGCAKFAKSAAGSICGQHQNGLREGRLRMKLVRITDAGAPIPGPAAGLYRISFPLHEQRLAASQKRILTDAEYLLTLYTMKTALRA